MEENWAQMGESNEEEEEVDEDESELPRYHLPPGSKPAPQRRSAKTRKVSLKRTAVTQVAEMHHDYDQEDDLGEVDEILAQRDDKFCVTYK